MNHEITEESGVSPNPPRWDYEAFGKDKSGKLYHRRYGQWFPRSLDIDLLHIELECFRVGLTVEDGGLGMYAHAKNAINLLFNWDKDEEPGFIWTPESELFIERACEWKYLAVCGSGSSGKSYPAAAWGLLKFVCSPKNTKVLMTSTSISAGCDRVWGATIEMYSRMPESMRSFSKLNDSKHLIKYIGDDENVKQGTRRGLELIAAEPKQAKDAVAKLIGRKAHNLILIGDELTDISPSVNTAFFTNLSRNAGSQMIGLGNPSDIFNALGELCEPEDGWQSVNITTKEWRTVRGYGIHFDDLESLNFKEGKKVVDAEIQKAEELLKRSLTEKEKDKIAKTHGSFRIHVWRPSFYEIETAKKLDGENSLMFLRMSRGWFANNGASDTIYAMSDLVKMPQTVEWDWDKDKPITTVSIDLSFSRNGDRCVMMRWNVGRDKSGKRMMEWKDTVILQDDATDTETTRSVQICKQIQDYVKKHEVPFKYVSFDATGAGAPFGDMLVGYLSREIYGVNFGGKASERAVSATDRRPSHERYSNRVSEIYYAGVEYVRGGQFAAIPDDAKSEMAIRTYEIASGNRILVQSKKEMKAKMGKSPDLADCVHINLDLCRERLGFSSQERGAQFMRKEDFIKQLRRLDIVARSGHCIDWSAA